jgi:hypothetical protein
MHTVIGGKNTPVATARVKANHIEGTAKQREPGSVAIDQPAEQRCEESETGDITGGYCAAHAKGAGRVLRQHQDRQARNADRQPAQDRRGDRGS